MGKPLNLQKTDDYENEVFVSYAWEEESQRIVDELERAFSQHGIPIRRDKKEIGYKGPLKSSSNDLDGDNALFWSLVIDTCSQNIACTN